MFATLSDSSGRRPVLLATFTLYTFATFSLALNKNVFSILLVLRALQSLRASAVLSIAYGVVANVCVPGERGRFLGPLLAVTNLGPYIEPVLGGWVAFGSGGYHWVFWCLSIYGASTLLALGWTFPETQRKLVGNGSLCTTGWRRSWWSHVEDWKRSRRNIVLSIDQSALGSGKDLSEPAVVKKEKIFKISNFVACIRMVFWKDTAFVLWMTASFYSVWYCVQISLPSVYQAVYSFNELDIGLTYLTGGAGVILGGLATGKLMDKNFEKTAREVELAVDMVSGDDIDCFPIERARSRGSWYMLGIFVGALVGYGWVIETKTHPNVPLILQVIIGFICTVFNQTYSALLMDIFPQNPSTAAASGNIARGALSGVVVASLQPLVRDLGRGWFFTLLGVTTGVTEIIAISLIRNCGRRWRGKRTLEAKDTLRSHDSRECKGMKNSEIGDQPEKKLTSSKVHDFSVETHIKTENRGEMAA